MLAAIDSSSWYSNPRHLRDLFRLIAYPIAFVIAAVAGWWHRRKQKIALSWPSVDGRVQFVTVAPVRDSSSYTATLQYSYFVEEYRSGEYTEIFDSEDDANSFIEKMTGQKVPVRYNPKNPTIRSSKKQMSSNTFNFLRSSEWLHCDSSAGAPAKPPAAAFH